jgi:DNA-binding response OmpR family regulator
MEDPKGHAATRILVVDDEPSIRLLCRVNLELDGHEVLEAHSLGTARATLAEEAVNVVVLDVHLHRERSDALVAECHARRPPIPVVLVTGSVDPSHPDLTRADAVLPKPFELDQLLSTVSRLARAPSPPMSTTTLRTPQEYEDAYEAYYAEAAEEVRAVRVGEKETSEMAAIVARHGDLFTDGQLEALRTAEAEAADGDEQERLYRLRRSCEAGIVDAELAAREDELENALLAGRLTFDGDELPLRAAQAQLAVLPEYAKRDELGNLVRTLDGSFNEQRRELLIARDGLEGELSGERDAVARNEAEKQISLRELENVLRRTADTVADEYARLCERWFERLLGPERADVPASAHVAWLRRLSPLEATYPKDRSVAVCVETVRGLGFDLEATPNIRLDLEDRPQKSPRACVIAADPPEIVHLITRAQGGLSDYQAFLHEAGHALHYAGCDPRLPWTFRALSRDHALTEIYSYICEAVTREPGWHALYFGLSDAEAEEDAEATRFLEAFLYRRYAAKLRYELGFWEAFPSEQGDSSRDYEPLLTDATGLRYDARGYLSDMDAGFYSVDYLRAWIRSAQLNTHLRREVGEDWWRNPGTGEILRGLFAEGTRPSTEEIAGRLGFDPLDTGPLVAELTAA